MCSSIQTQVGKAILCIRNILCLGLECHWNQWGREAALRLSQSPSPTGLAPPNSLQEIVNLAPIYMTFHLDEDNGLQASLPQSLRLSFCPPSLPHPFYLTIPSPTHSRLIPRTAGSEVPTTLDILLGDSEATVSSGKTTGWESHIPEFFWFFVVFLCFGHTSQSCLENPRDGGAWWAAVYGVAQSRTRLKWLSSSSSTACGISSSPTGDPTRTFSSESSRVLSTGSPGDPYICLNFNTAQILCDLSGQAI